ncbi:hypothetical protein FQN60_015752 [Etheostoma spectabile]|uniref:Uncharacterized protein n=1 Tax=Etheostoma spectabile TaxID=54343 RepID=A0A5J5CRG7_9PERO|nr:hypothetical protein FQN60_015752 [Etheostoma spectabile]
MWSCSGLSSGYCQGPDPNPDTVHWVMAVCSGNLIQRRGAWLLQRNVLTPHHDLYDFLCGVWHIQELPAVSEPGARSSLWSQHQTRSLSVWLGGRYSSVSDRVQARRRQHAQTQVPGSSSLSAEHYQRRGLHGALQRSGPPNAERRAVTRHILPDLHSHLRIADGQRKEKTSLERRDAGRWNSRNCSLDCRNTHGLDQSPSADGRSAADEAIQGFLSLHLGDSEGGGSGGVLQELGHQLPACGPRQHGGVCYVRACQRFPPGRQCRPSSSRVRIESTNSLLNLSYQFAGL